VEKEIAFYGAGNVGTMLGETMIGTGGVIPPPPEYWPLVCDICEANEVLVINDEVITGFGRTGEWFACESFGSRPDLITMAKASPPAICRWGRRGQRARVSGLPGRAARGQTVHERRHLPRTSSVLRGRSRQSRDHRARGPGRTLPGTGYLSAGGPAHSALPPHRGRRPGLGLVAGIEYVQSKATKEWFPASVGAAARVRDAAFQRGVFVRLLGGGHCHAIAPPFVISREQIDTIVKVLDESITVVEKEMGY